VLSDIYIINSCVFPRIWLDDVLVLDRFAGAKPSKERIRSGEALFSMNRSRCPKYTSSSNLDEAQFCEAPAVCIDSGGWVRLIAF